MAAIDDIPVVQLGVEDAAAGLVLSTEAHWNQNEDDWRFFLREGVVFGVHDGAQLVATAALLPYSGNNAWISMVLVTASHRRRGLATRLVDTCLETARKRGLTSWLDATPAGAAVYGPLGFTPTLQLRRMRLERSTRGAAAPPAPATLDALCARDRRTTGFDRTALLTAFAQRSGSRIAAASGSIALVRDGRIARHIGPVLANDAATALTLVDAIAQSESGPLLIDAVASQKEFLEGLATAGWTTERPFQRMRFGPATKAGEEPPFAVAGPEFG
ncbi:GNAT family N-acetyltransferase [Bradyrhizobium sp. CB1650]|uniref:GNAT family N-acetyltransferase n=1 Tax=Bradyrhizobium sp. CB1650 TaxID=3039153 RepID=UPI002435E0FE|nr:GNAT family N-acetyltransferase [Bradyrhizobium sp. CB1650]WGD48895.1 GNAT family N-acetyltransferase [Bradyrhizobium sp. CB1650]